MPLTGREVKAKGCLFILSQRSQILHEVYLKFFSAFNSLRLRLSGAVFSKKFFTRGDTLSSPRLIQISFTRTHLGLRYRIHTKRCYYSVNTKWSSLGMHQERRWCDSQDLFSCVIPSALMQIRITLNIMCHSALGPTRRKLQGFISKPEMSHSFRNAEIFTLKHQRVGLFEQVDLVD